MKALSLWLYEVPLALRRLWRRPTTTALMLATFTVSASLSILGWSLFHTIYLKNPEYDPNGTLYHISFEGENAGRKFQGGASPDDFDAWKTRQTVFSDVAAVGLYRSTFVTIGDAVHRLLSANLSTEALRMTQAKPLLGRLFIEAEDKPGSPPAILLSERTWRNYFDADPGVIGRILQVDGKAATVVGVMPESYVFPNEQEMWQSMGYNANARTPRDLSEDVIARLKPGKSPGQAAADLQMITEQLGPQTQASQLKLHVVVEPLRDYYVLPEMWRSALVLFVLAMIFVFAGCANAANLSLIDFLSRGQELAAMLAVGVPRAAAVRGLACQLAAIAGVAGLISIGVLLGAGPYVHDAMARGVTPYWLRFHLEWHHFAVALALAASSVFVAMLAPVAYLFVQRPEQIIREGSVGSRGAGRTLGRRILLVGQVALLTVLAVAAVLLVRSSSHVGEEHWGFDARKIFASKVSAIGGDLSSPQARMTAQYRLIDEIERLPGVTASALVTTPVGFSGDPQVWYARTADGLAEGRSEGGAIFSQATPHIFDVFGAPFVEGETFRREAPVPPPANGAPPPALAVVINQHLAWRLWPGQQALGRPLFIRFSNPKMTPIQATVSGVVRDFQGAGPKAANNDIIYCSYLFGMPGVSFLYARGERSPPSLEDIRLAIHRADPRLAVYLPSTLQQVIDIELSAVHLTTRLTMVYALAAVLLCGIGVYSLTVSQVLQRQREFGIRMALGIAPRPLWAHFARGHVLTAAIGVGVGLVAAGALMRVAESLLFGVDARDPLTYFGTALLILVVSALACVPSLFRLQRINPADCLRSL